MISYGIKSKDIPGIFEYGSFYYKALFNIIFG